MNDYAKRRDIVVVTVAGPSIVTVTLVSPLSPQDAGCIPAHPWRMASVDSGKTLPLGRDWSSWREYRSVLFAVVVVVVVVRFKAATTSQW